jgi:hypothetical protein
MHVPTSPADILRPRLLLGRVLATPGAIEALVEARCDGGELLDRHARADWGELDADDRARNDAALVAGGRVLSAYSLCTGATLWIITEHDRSCTTLLLPSDY